MSRQAPSICKKCNKPGCQERNAFSETLNAISTLSSQILSGNTPDAFNRQTFITLGRGVNFSEIPPSLYCTPLETIERIQPRCPCRKCTNSPSPPPDITCKKEENPEPVTNSREEELKEDMPIKLEEPEMDLNESVEGTPMQVHESVSLVASGSANNTSENGIAEGSEENDFKPMHKGNILEKRSLAFVKMVYNRTHIQIDIFDDDSAPVLNQQIIMKKNDIYEKLIHFEAINGLRYLIEEIKIPQIVTFINQIYLCPLMECNVGFLDPVLARSHAVSHLDHKPFSCKTLGCEWTFSKENHLQRHQLTHENTKNYPCNEPGCDKLFTTIYNLNEHRKKRHVQPATKICPVDNCEEMFRNTKELRKHCIQHDQSEAPFKCPTPGCKRAFFFQNTLEFHRKRHLLENLHICNYKNCNKIFQQAYRLKEHMRCHTGTKPYKCTIGKCAKAFSTASKLKRHEQTHFNDKHHYCNIEGCDKAFKRSDHLKEHMRQVHKFGRRKASVAVVPVETTRTEPVPSTSFAENNTKPALGVLGSSPLATVVKMKPGRLNLPTYIAMKADPNNPDRKKSDDELLEEAIKSIGNQEMKLETDLFLDVPLDLSDFSTVNLRDLQ